MDKCLAISTSLTQYSAFDDKSLKFKLTLGSVLMTNRFPFKTKITASPCSWFRGEKCNNVSVRNVEGGLRCWKESIDSNIENIYGWTLTLLDY